MDKNLEKLFDIFVRRRWYLIISFCFSMSAGIALAVFLPKTYEAGALIAIETRNDPAGLVQPIVPIDVGTEINTISERIVSRANLEKIINRLNLYQYPGKSNMPMEEKVEDMRRHVRIDITSGRGDKRDIPNSFKISFRGESPEKAAAVANMLASCFIDENLKVREGQASGAGKFLEGELTLMKEKRETIEEAMKEYRKEHMRELPEQLENNLRILDRLQGKLIDRQTRLSDAKNRLAILEKSLLLSGKAPPKRDETSNIDRLRDELKSMKAKYTDQHPDVIRLQRKIYSQAREAENRKSEKESDSADAYRVGNRQKFTGIKAEIEALQKEVSEYQKQIALYKNRVENTPKREQELISLKREYQNIQESYASLLGRRFETELAGNREQKQKGERFRIIDAAKVPEEPVSPDMKRLFLPVMAAGLGISTGIVFLLEHRDSSFRRVEEVEAYLGLPVITMIPSIVYSSDIRKKQLQKIAVVFSLLLSFILVTGFSAVTFLGVNKIQELIMRFVQS